MLICLLPPEPYTAALGETRTVADDQTVRLGSVRYSVPRRFVGTGLAEFARHPRSTPGQPRIDDAHYLDHPAGRRTLRARPRPVDPAEIAFLALGPGHPDAGDRRLVPAPRLHRRAARRDGRLTYLRSRYYDPSIGRFTSRDTWPGSSSASQTLNRYAYVDGNPTTRSDPSGHCGIDVVVDVGFIIYDLGSLAFGPPKDWEGNLVALGADVGGAALACATGLALVARGSIK